MASELRRKLRETVRLRSENKMVQIRLNGAELWPKNGSKKGGPLRKPYINCLYMDLYKKNTS